MILPQNIIIVLYSVFGTSHVTAILQSNWSIFDFGNGLCSDVSSLLRVYTAEVRLIARSKTEK